MNTPPEMARRRAKVEQIEAAEQARLVDWLKSRPGVFGPFKSETEAWQDALRAFGGCLCGMGFFRFQLRRIGYGVEEAPNGFRLDLSDPSLVIEAD